MPKCLRPECQKEATRAMKLSFYASLDSPPETAFISFTVCADHPLNDAETKWFLDTNWKQLCGGFSQTGGPLPVRELTKCEWAPLDEAEEFWKEGLVPAAQRKALNN